MTYQPTRPLKWEVTIRDIKRRTRSHFNAEEKIAMVLEGLRGEDSIAEVCRKQGITSSLYYKWSKAFIDAGKRKLSGDIKREADTSQVDHMRKQKKQEEGTTQGKSRQHNYRSYNGIRLWVFSSKFQPLGTL